MYVERTRKRQGEKVYEQILLRESYRARKGKVDKRTLLNLTHFPREQVEAIAWALRNPQAVALATGDKGLSLREGKSVGAVWAVAEVWDLSAHEVLRKFVLVPALFLVVRSVFLIFLDLVSPPHVARVAKFPVSPDYLQYPLE